MRKPSPRTFAYATMYTGIAATLAGNAATADWSDPIAVAIAAFPAAGLFVTFEMVMRGASRVKRATLRDRLRTGIALAAVAACAYVSVGHLLELARDHGQHGPSAWIVAVLPDLMMMLAAVVLNDTPAPARRTRKTAATPARSRARKADGPIPAPPVSDLLPGRRKTAAA